MLNMLNIIVTVNTPGGGPVKFSGLKGAKGAEIGSIARVPAVVPI